MTDRAMITQHAQIGAESVHGTAVAALKRLLCTGIEPAPKLEIEGYRPPGYKFQTSAHLQKEWVEAKITGKPSYNDLAYLWSGLLNYAAPAQQGGTAAYLWSFGIDTFNPDTIKTFTVEMGSQTRAARFAYGLITALGFRLSKQQGSELTGTMVGRALEDDVHLSTNATYTLTAAGTPPTDGTFTLTYAAQTTDPIAYNAEASAVEAALEALSTIGAGNVEVTATVATGAGTLAVAANVYTIEFVNDLAQAARTLTGTFTSLDPSASIALAAGVVGVTPTDVAEVPMLNGHTSVYMDSAAASLGNTKLLRCFDINFSLDGRHGMEWPLNSAIDGFATHSETEPKLQLKLLVGADDVGMGLLPAARLGTKKFLRIESIGPQIEGAYYYTQTLDLCAAVADIGEFRTTDGGLYAVEYTLDAKYDATWEDALQVALTNTLSGL